MKKQANQNNSLNNTAFELDTTYGNKKKANDLPRSKKYIDSRKASQNAVKYTEENEVERRALYKLQNDNQFLDLNNISSNDPMSIKGR